MSDQTGDAALVAACRRGEGSALALLVERYQADVFGTALRLCHNRDAALELTNTIFFKAYQNLHTYDMERPLRPWLLRIATNETLNWLRAQRREREHVLDSEAAFEVIAGGDDPEDATLALERRREVRTALAALPERYRVVLTLRYFDDLSYAEIAEITGQDTNAVGVQLLRGRALLKTALTTRPATEQTTPEGRR